MTDHPKQPAERRPETVPNDPEQSARFIEAARKLGCEENFAQFEEALNRIVKAKPRPLTPGKLKQP